MAQSDMTYRVTGQQLSVWAVQSFINGSYVYPIFSNNGVVLETLNGLAYNWGSPRITINFTNQRDLYLDWTEGYDLNQNGSMEQAVFVQEFYP